VPLPCRRGDGPATAAIEPWSNIRSARKMVMESPSASADQVFVLRFWREANDGERAHASWRVQISHVNSRRRLYAHGLDQAFGLVREVLKASLGTSRKSGKGGVRTVAVPRAFIRSRN